MANALLTIRSRNLKYERYTTDLHVCNKIKTIWPLWIVVTSDHKMVQESKVFITVFKTSLIKEFYKVKNIIKKRKQIATVNAGCKTIT